jgi:hypothetical protein
MENLRQKEDHPTVDFVAVQTKGKTETDTPACPNPVCNRDRPDLLTIIG